MTGDEFHRFLRVLEAPAIGALCPDTHAKKATAGGPQKHGGKSEKFSKRRNKKDDRQTSGMAAYSQSNSVRNKMEK